jgi:hypothetical protein
MNWTEFLAKIFTLVPYVVAGINTVHAEKDSATKTQIASDTLAIASQAASTILTGANAQASAAASAAVNAAIVAVQAVHDASK